MGLGCFAKLNASVWKILCALLLPAPGCGFFLSYQEGKVCEKLCKAGTLPLNRHTRMQNKDLLFFQPSTQNFVFSLQGPLVFATKIMSIIIPSLHQHNVMLLMQRPMDGWVYLLQTKNILGHAMLFTITAITTVSQEFSLDILSLGKLQKQYLNVTR